jgi:hypothetical protein
MTQRARGTRSRCRRAAAARLASRARLRGAGRAARRGGLWRGRTARARGPLPRRARRRLPPGQAPAPARVASTTRSRSPGCIAPRPAGPAPARTARAWPRGLRSPRKIGGGGPARVQSTRGDRRGVAWRGGRGPGLGGAGAGRRPWPRARAPARRALHAVRPLPPRRSRCRSRPSGTPMELQEALRGRVLHGPRSAGPWGITSHGGRRPRQRGTQFVQPARRGVGSGFESGRRAWRCRKKVSYRPAGAACVRAFQRRAFLEREGAGPRGGRGNAQSSGNRDRARGA